MNKKQTKLLIRIIASAVLLVALHFSQESGLIRFALYMVPYLIAGYDILVKALRGIRNRQLFDECFLMSVATIGAIALALSGGGDYTEAVAVMLFYQIGEWFQSYAVGKSRRNITELMDIRPDYANVARDGCITRTDPDEVAVGSVIIVNPGEKVPIDGVVISGTSSLDTVALTGESVPRDVGEGDEIVSGCVNLSGVLQIRTTREFGDSTVSRVLDLVENASFRKSRSEAFITRFARVYTPAVCYSALALALLPPVFRMLSGLSPMWGDWVYRALTFLVISCPCALVISIPLSFFAGIGGASNAGVLVKGSNYLEILSKTRYIVFDKTGTLTKGVFEVSAIRNGSLPDDALLYYAAHAESASSHPVSLSLKRAYGKDIDFQIVTDIHEHAGKGVTAVVGSHTVAAGNAKLMEELQIAFRDTDDAGTLIHVAVDNDFKGTIVISDVIKENSRAAIHALRGAGIKRAVMLSGDNEKTARAVATTLNIDEVHASLLPEEKVSILEDLLSKRPDNEPCAFVGDGINDAPVLSRADIGIAMGALGSDAAIEAADIVLMDDDPLKIAKAIRIAKKCVGIVKQNIVFAIGVKLVCLLLGALGIANMWLAIFADVGVMVIAVLNAIRALFVKNI